MQCLSLVHRDSNDITYVASIKEQGYQYAKRLKQTFVVVLKLKREWNADADCPFEGN